MLLAKDKAFPCYLGTIAEGKNLLRWTYAEEAEMDAPFAFRDALADYLGFCGSLPGRTVLVAFLGASPEGWDEARYEERFWRTLQFLRDNDPEPWPEAYPTDPDDPAWEFCFAGKPLFVSGHSPCHRRRRTRRFGTGLGMVVQTRKNMEGLVGDAPAAAGVRAKIRGLIGLYDDLPPSPRLGSYGDPHALEWKQYWLPDDDSVQPPARCPLVVRR
jgi:FPC/CPF motif-containing protein YcgG